MHIDTHSPTARPALPFPQSTMRQTQMLPSLTRRGKGQAGKGRAGGDVSRREASEAWDWACQVSPAPQGQKLVSVGFHHRAEGAQRKVGVWGGRHCLGKSNEVVASFGELCLP